MTGSGSGRDGGPRPAVRPTPRARSIGEGLPVPTAGGDLPHHPKNVRATDVSTSAPGDRSPVAHPLGRHKPARTVTPLPGATADYHEHVGVLAY